ncbi:MAG: hypothetical protein MJ247_07250 [Alphaproteobacteria bacterium]|nr:hypothetical protein [Alphaproteobacteria bacterium]
MKNKFLLFLMFSFCVSLSSECFAKTRKLMDGDNMNGAQSPLKLKRKAEKICESNNDCEYNQECVGLMCMHVCTKDTCPSNKFCIAVKSVPHEYRCVRCYSNKHCPKGFICSKETFDCEKEDPCKRSVCSPGAPYCIPVPYKTLPYTCVQCLEDSHCPPVAGLSRSCVDNYCLFNVEGNIPNKNAVKEEVVEEDYEEKTEMVPEMEPSDKNSLNENDDENNYVE